MPMSPVGQGRTHAELIWRAGVDVVRPERLMRLAFTNNPELAAAINDASRILVVGAGKAGASMSRALEAVAGDNVSKINGIVNVPSNAVRPLRRIRLHSGRPAASNHPTAEGVAGSEHMLELVSQAGPDDIGLCLISGGGSALLPAPADAVSLADKQIMTKALHRCGATIREMNCVRKHLSKIKGGRLAQAFTGQRLFSLIISDVVGDPLDVIASGPTAPDPTTFQDALEVLKRYELLTQAPASIRTHLEAGATGKIVETPKTLPDTVRNVLIGNNRMALDAARSAAVNLGLGVLDLGSFVEGETQQVATVVAGIVRSIREQHQPLAAPACILLGGETTVTLAPNSGKGGRNQEFALALLAKLAESDTSGVTILSGGTDGEDGPTDAAGAVVDDRTLHVATRLGLSLSSALACHDAYPFLDACGSLLRTGLTETNVMDLRVIVIE